MKGGKLNLKSYGVTSGDLKLSVVKELINTFMPYADSILEDIYDISADMSRIKVFEKFLKNEPIEMSKYTEEIDGLTTFHNKNFNVFMMVIEKLRILYQIYVDKKKEVIIDTKVIKPKPVKTASVESNVPKVLLRKNVEPVIVEKIIDKTLIESNEEFIIKKLYNIFIHNDGDILLYDNNDDDLRKMDKFITSNRFRYYFNDEEGMKFIVQIIDKDFKTSKLFRDFIFKRYNDILIAIKNTLYPPHKPKTSVMKEQNIKRDEYIAPGIIIDRNVVKKPLFKLIKKPIPIEEEVIQTEKYVKGDEESDSGGSFDLNDKFDEPNKDLFTTEAEVEQDDLIEHNRIKEITKQHMLDIDPSIKRDTTFLKKIVDSDIGEKSLKQLSFINKRKLGSLLEQTTNFKEQTIKAKQANLEFQEKYTQNNGVRLPISKFYTMEYIKKWADDHKRETNLMLNNVTSYRAKPLLDDILYQFESLTGDEEHFVNYVRVFTAGNVIIYVPQIYMNYSAANPNLNTMSENVFTYSLADNMTLLVKRYAGNNAETIGDIINSATTFYVINNSTNLTLNKYLGDASLSKIKTNLIQTYDNADASFAQYTNSFNDAMFSKGHRLSLIELYNVFKTQVKFGEERYKLLFKIPFAQTTWYEFLSEEYAILLPKYIPALDVISLPKPEGNSELFKNLNMNKLVQVPTVMDDIVRVFPLKVQYGINSRLLHTLVSIISITSDEEYVKFSGYLESMSNRMYNGILPSATSMLRHTLVSIESLLNRYYRYTVNYDLLYNTYAELFDDNIVYQDLNTLLQKSYLYNPKLLNVFTISLLNYMQPNDVLMRMATNDKFISLYVSTYYNKLDDYTLNKIDFDLSTGYSKMYNYGTKFFKLFSVNPSSKGLPINKKMKRSNTWGQEIFLANTFNKNIMDIIKDLDNGYATSGLPVMMHTYFMKNKNEPIKVDALPRNFQVSYNYPNMQSQMFVIFSKYLLKDSKDGNSLMNFSMFSSDFNEFWKNNLNLVEDEQRVYNFCDNIFVFHKVNGAVKYASLDVIKGESSCCIQFLEIYYRVLKELFRDRFVEYEPILRSTLTGLVMCNGIHNASNPVLSPIIYLPSGTILTSDMNHTMTNVIMLFVKICDIKILTDDGKLTESFVQLMLSMGVRFEIALYNENMLTNSKPKMKLLPGLKLIEADFLGYDIIVAPNGTYLPVLAADRYIKEFLFDKSNPHNEYAELLEFTRVRGLSLNGWAYHINNVVHTHLGTLTFDYVRDHMKRDISYNVSSDYYKFYNYAKSTLDSMLEQSDDTAYKVLKMYGGAIPPSLLDIIRIISDDATALDIVNKMYASEGVPRGDFSDNIGNYMKYYGMNAISGLNLNEYATLESFLKDMYGINASDEVEQLKRYEKEKFGNNIVIKDLRRNTIAKNIIIDNTVVSIPLSNYSALPYLVRTFGIDRFKNILSDTPWVILRPYFMKYLLFHDLMNTPKLNQVRKDGTVTLHSNSLDSIGINGVATLVKGYKMFDVHYKSGGSSESIKPGISSYKYLIEEGLSYYDKDSKLGNGNKFVTVKHIYPNVVPVTVVSADFIDVLYLIYCFGYNEYGRLSNSFDNFLITYYISKLKWNVTDSIVFLFYVPNKVNNINPIESSVMYTMLMTPEPELIKLRDYDLYSKNKYDFNTFNLNSNVDLYSKLAPQLYDKSLAWSKKFDYNQVGMYDIMIPQQGSNNKTGLEVYKNMMHNLATRKIKDLDELLLQLLRNSDVPSDTFILDILREKYGLNNIKITEMSIVDVFPFLQVGNTTNKLRPLIDNVFIEDVLSGKVNYPMVRLYSVKRIEKSLYLNLIKSDYTVGIKRLIEEVRKRHLNVDDNVHIIEPSKPDPQLNISYKIKSTKLWKTPIASILDDDVLLNELAKSWSLNYEFLKYLLEDYIQLDNSKEDFDKVSTLIDMLNFLNVKDYYNDYNSYVKLDISGKKINRGDLAEDITKQLKTKLNVKMNTQIVEAKVKSKSYRKIVPGLGEVVAYSAMMSKQLVKRTVIKCNYDDIKSETYNEMKADIINSNIFDIRSNFITNNYNYYFNDLFTVDNNDVKAVMVSDDYKKIDGFRTSLLDEVIDLFREELYDCYDIFNIFNYNLKTQTILDIIKFCAMACVNDLDHTVLLFCMYMFQIALGHMGMNGYSEDRGIIDKAGLKNDEIAFIKLQCIVTSTPDYKKKDKYCIIYDKLSDIYFKGYVNYTNSNAFIYYSYLFLDEKMNYDKIKNKIKQSLDLVNLGKVKVNSLWFKRSLANIGVVDIPCRLILYTTPNYYVLEHTNTDNFNNRNCMSSIYIHRNIVKYFYYSDVEIVIDVYDDCYYFISRDNDIKDIKIFNNTANFDKDDYYQEFKDIVKLQTLSYLFTLGKRCGLSDHKKLEIDYYVKNNLNPALLITNFVTKDDIML